MPVAAEVSSPGDRRWWRLPGSGGFELEVRIGKPLDVLALKRTSLGELREYARDLASTAAELFAAGGPRRELESCPMCRALAQDADVAAEIYGAAYRRCRRCGHGFIGSQPAPEQLDRRYAESDQLAATYTDAASLQVRMEQVIGPKLTWTLGAFDSHCGGKPQTAIDVGAGGGHFVAAARERGIATEGYELSVAARRFAKQAFGVELRGEDFRAAQARAELVTFWGLLEYTPEPRRFLEAARAALPDDRGMLIVEVPRLDCLSTAAQREHPSTVARHLDPTSHLNLFSETGLAIAFDETGFKPVAAWYFGMDAYELAVQLALRLGDDMLPRLAESLFPLQAVLDAALLCDDVVVAAVPTR